MSGIVQSAKGNNTSNVNTVSKAYAGAVTAGNSLIAIVGATLNPTNTFSISDSVNGAWPAADFSNAAAGSNAVAVFRLQTAAAGTPTVTANMTGTAAPMFLTIWEVNGLVLSPLDRTVAASTAAGVAPTSGPTALTTNANELWIGVMQLQSNAAGAITATGGWTLDQTNDNFLGTEFQIVSSTGTPASAFLLGGGNGASSAENLVVTYILGGGGGGGGGTDTDQFLLPGRPMPSLGGFGAAGMFAQPIALGGAMYMAMPRNTLPAPNNPLPGINGSGGYSLELGPWAGLI